MSCWGCSFAAGGLGLAGASEMLNIGDFSAIVCGNGCALLRSCMRVSL